MESIFNKLSENIYFIGVSIDGLHTISVGTQTPSLLPCNLKNCSVRISIYTPKSKKGTLIDWHLVFHVLVIHYSR